MTLSVNIFGEEHLGKPYSSDVFRFDRGAGVISPRNNFVVSRNTEGAVLSYYHDDVWDLSPFSPSSAEVRIYFENISNAVRREEAKRFMFVLMLFGSGRSGTVLSPKRLYAYFQYLLVPISDYSDQASLTIREFFESDKALDSFARLLKKKHIERIPLFLSALSLLASVDSKNSGITYRHNKKMSSALSAYFNKHYTIEQTPPIPVSIFRNATLMRWRHFEAVDGRIDLLIPFIEKCMSRPFYARTRVGGTITWNRKKMTSNRKTSGLVLWDDAVSESGLEKLFSEYEVKSRHDFEHFLSRFYYTCKHLILSYTGMRHKESILLTSECLKMRDSGKTAHIMGVTTKLAGMPTKINWVTVSEMQRVVLVLRKIGSAILSGRNLNPDEVPLFVNAKLFSQQTKSANQTGQDVSSFLRFSDKELELQKSGILITEADVLELEDIAPGKSWREDEDFQIGKPWKFNYHQYRRSLAIYALNSGVVSIAALRDQFGHLFSEMSAYYGRGAGSAKSLVGTDGKHHIKNEIKKLKPLFDFLSYSKNVLFSKEPLYGPHGVYVQKNKATLSEHILSNRKETTKKFEKGFMVYTETVLGGCTSLEPCDNHLTGCWTACLGCDGAELKMSKVGKAIAVQKEVVKGTEKGSIEHRSESRELAELQKWVKIMERKENGTN